jgi:hypothetical protein
VLGPLAGLLTAFIRSPDVRWESQPSEVLTRIGSFDVDLLMLTFTLLGTVFSIEVGSPEICVGTFDVDLNS